MSTLTLDRHIASTPGLLGGKPCIAGRRISVADIAVWHERMARSVDEICAEYNLSLAEVHAALAYYFDHKLEIDARLQEDDAFVAGLRASTPSSLDKRLKVLRGD
jgi:uncharacterized protein (DUF433 family)